MNLLYQFLDKATHTLIDLDPDTKRKLTELEGKVLCIKIRSPDLTLYLLPGENGIEVRERIDDSPDVTLSGPLSAFIKLGLDAKGEDRNRVFSEGGVTMEGNAEVGQAFQKAMSDLDIDFEELLSRYIGDTPARKVGVAAQGLRSWAEDAIDLSRENMADYLTEEKEVLVTPVKMERFEKSIDILRSDVDRLEQRIKKLERQFA